ncbi:MAG TPA: type II secretion system F family protein [Rhizomicrobium sp.]|nr:type II secretion system F family protein [Rhizomicrobium sp.]
MTNAGAVVSGTLDAPSQAAVIQQLRGQGHFPISAVPADADEDLWSRLRNLQFSRRVSPRLLSTVTQELAALVSAGLELDRALGILVKLSNIGALREPLSAIRARVRDGASLADAMAAERVFPKFYVSMVRAGELGGSLDVTLRRLADYLARSAEIRETVVSALVYPAILLCTTGFSIVVILVFVLPEFEPLFANAGKALPLSTRIVMDIGDAVQDFWWLPIMLGIAGWLWLRQALRKPGFRRRWDGYFLRLPVFGSLLAEIEIERFSRALGTLLSNGVSLTTALGHAREVLRNAKIAEAVGETARKLREGQGLAQYLAQSKVFPPLTLDLVQIGEETGKLDEMLLRQADLDEQSIKQRVDRLLALLVPCLTIVLGVIVAGLIASMLVAILGVNDLALQ